MQCLVAFQRRFPIKVGSSVLVKTPVRLRKLRLQTGDRETKPCVKHNTLHRPQPGLVATGVKRTQSLTIHSFRVGLHFLNIVTVPYHSADAPLCKQRELHCLQYLHESLVWKWAHSRWNYLPKALVHKSQPTFALPEAATRFIESVYLGTKNRCMVPVHLLTKRGYAKC